MLQRLCTVSPGFMYASAMGTMVGMDQYPASGAAAVVAEQALVEHALRHTLVADALALQVCALQCRAYLPCLGLHCCDLAETAPDLWT